MNSDYHTVMGYVFVLLMVTVLAFMYAVAHATLATVLGKPKWGGFKFFLLVVVTLVGTFSYAVYLN